MATKEVAVAIIVVVVIG